MRKFRLQSDNTTWGNIQDSGNYQKQFRLIVKTMDGTTTAGTFDGEKIIEVKPYQSIYGDSTFTIGATVSSEIDLTIIPTDANGNIVTIPTTAQITLQGRLFQTESEYSAWCQLGVYYVDTRSTDKETGYLTIHGYDAMQKANNALYELGVSSSDTFPCTYRTMAQRIATAIGSELESTSQITTAFSFPTLASVQGYSMRELLSAIAMSGCWTFADVEKTDGWHNVLRLVKPSDIPEEGNVLIDHYGNELVFGGDKIIVG